MPISDKTIQTLKAGKTKRRINIDARGGRGIGRLLVDVHPTGRKVFLFRYIVAGKRSFITIGPYGCGRNGGTFTLAQARSRADELSELLSAHGDLKAHLQAEQARLEVERHKVELEHAKQGTFAELLAAYVQKLNREAKRSTRAVESAFKCPYWRSCRTWSIARRSTLRPRIFIASSHN